jgi:tetratricopeptide (TPR) repeat protein
MLEQVVKTLIENFPQILFFAFAIAAAGILLREFRQIRRELAGDVSVQVRAELGAMFGDILKQIETARVHVQQMGRLQAEFEGERAKLAEEISASKAEITKTIGDMRSYYERFQQLMPSREDLLWVSPRELVLRAGEAGSWKDAATYLANIDINNATSKDFEVAGDVCRRHRFLAKAIEYYERACDKDPDNISARAERLALIAESRASERTDALRALQDLISSNPTMTGILIRYLNVLIDLGRYSDMAAFCETRLRDARILTAAIRLRLYRNLAVAYGELDRPDDALKQYEAALKIDPNHVDTLKSYAIDLRDLNRLEEADEISKKLLSIDPLQPSLYLLRARVKTRQGDLSTAREVLETARTLAGGVDLMEVERELRLVSARLSFAATGRVDAKAGAANT